MTNIDKIKKMSPENLAKFLIRRVHSTEVCYDYDENPFERVVDVWVTPFETFPGWWPKEEVVDDVVKYLLEEV